MATVRGVQATKRNMRAMTKAVSGNAIDAACFASLEPLRQEIDTAAPRPSLKGTAVIVKRASRGERQRVFWVSFRGMGRMIAHLIEFGTQFHSLAKGASVRKGLLQHVPPWHPGDPPHPFVRPAYERTRSQVVAEFGRRAYELMVAAIQGRK